ncbi:unnamed protein product, partial [Ilex paraguariensis]
KEMEQVMLNDVLVTQDKGTTTLGQSVCSPQGDDDECGLVRNKEPPDKGFFSDSGSTLHSRELLGRVVADSEGSKDSDDVTLEFSSAEPKVGVEKIQRFAFSVGMPNFTVNKLAEKFIWPLLDDQLEVKVLFVHAHSITME